MNWRYTAFVRLIESVNQNRLMNLYCHFLMTAYDSVVWIYNNWLKLLPGNSWLGSSCLSLCPITKAGLNHKSLFIEEASQPRRQETYKHPKPVLQQGAGDRIIKGKELGWGWEWMLLHAEFGYCSWSSDDEMMAWLLMGKAWPCLMVLLAWWVHWTLSAAESPPQSLCPGSKGVCRCTGLRNET